MARTGNFGGFVFDEEVFTGMMEEQETWSTPIILSGVVQKDQSIMDAIGTEGNVATIPMYLPLNAYEEEMQPLNNDGDTANTPVEVAGGKQTCMLIQRMKAFKSKDFTKELTSADPMTHVKNKIKGYYNQVWERELMNIAQAVMDVAALSTHVTDLSVTASPQAANLITANTLIDAEQAALGDMAGGMGLILMHSKIYAAYQKLELVEFKKYASTDGLGKEVVLPTIGSKIVKVSDNFTVDTSQTAPIYNTYLFGEGAFLSADKTNYEKQYYTNYDPETAAGIEKFYTKQGKVLHPNGLSLAVDSIVKESPTFAELGSQANWSLKFDPKNVRVGVIRSNG